jgi:hypothetical protein
MLLRDEIREDLQPDCAALLQIDAGERVPAVVGDEVRGNLVVAQGGKERQRLLNRHNLIVNAMYNQRRRSQ